MNDDLAIFTKMASTKSWSSMIKIFCSDTAMKVCEIAMDVLSNHSIYHKNYVENILEMHG